MMRTRNGLPFLGSVILLIFSLLPAAVRVTTAPRTFTELSAQVDHLGPDASPEEIGRLLPESPATPRDGQEANEVHSLSVLFWSRAILARRNGRAAEARQWQALSDEARGWLPKNSPRQVVIPQK
jgi:hypothetical protein